MDFEGEFIQTQKIKNDLDRVNRQYKILNDLTQLQDSIQLSISALNGSIANSNAMINDANALILEASKWKGDIRPQVRHGYAYQKVKSLVNDWNCMVHDFNVTEGTNLPLMNIEEQPESDEPITDEKVLKNNREEIFRGLVFDIQNMMWKKTKEL